jgi:hypothetical protein
MLPNVEGMANIISRKPCSDDCFLYMERTFVSGSHKMIGDIEYSFCAYAHFCIFVDIVILRRSGRPIYRVKGDSHTAVMTAAVMAFNTGCMKLSRFIFAACKVAFIKQVLHVIESGI